MRSFKQLHVKHPQGQGVVSWFTLFPFEVLQLRSTHAMSSKHRPRLASLSFQLQSQCMAQHGVPLQRGMRRHESFRLYCRMAAWHCKVWIGQDRRYLYTTCPELGNSLNVLQIFNLRQASVLALQTCIHLVGFRQDPTRSDMAKQAASADEGRAAQLLISPYGSGSTLEELVGVLNWKAQWCALEGS